MHVKSYQDENEALYTKNTTFYLEINIQKFYKAIDFNKNNTGINNKLFVSILRTKILFML